MRGDASMALQQALRLVLRLGVLGVFLGLYSDKLLGLAIPELRDLLLLADLVLFYRFGHRLLLSLLNLVRTLDVPGQPATLLPEETEGQRVKHAAERSSRLLGLDKPHVILELVESRLCLFWPR